MPKAWIQNRKRDYYYKKAKLEKYRSRATYKLFEAIRRYHFIEYGDVVVDLGAAPGGLDPSGTKNRRQKRLCPRRRPETHRTVPTTLRENDSLRHNRRRGS